MTYPNIKPCPTCRSDENIIVYRYESGGKHVECIKCNYLGPGEGSIRQAIKRHNARVAEQERECPKIAELRRQSKRLREHFKRELSGGEGK